jgi:hypothetical protein
LVYSVKRRPSNNSGYIFPALRGLFSFLSQGTKRPARKEKGKSERQSETICQKPVRSWMMGFSAWKPEFEMGPKN